jgi:protein TonB
MFEESLVESTGVLAQRSRWPVVLSFGAQLIVAAAIITIPLLHPEVLQIHAPLQSLVAPRFKAPDPPPPQRVRVVATEATNAFTAPSNPQPINTGASKIPAMDTGADPGPAPSGASMIVGMNSSGAALPFGSPSSSGPHVVRAEPAGSSAPARISQGVIAGLLVNPIRPDYPAIAKATHTEGTVIVHAIISKSGHIESAQAISGPGLLRGAALQAVERAQYRPYLLNGLPTEVETTISIVFHLNS